jgi:hypothetical protein
MKRLLLVVGAGAIGLLSVSVPPALADSPLPTPTNLQALHVADTSAELTWNASSLVQTDVVQRQVNGVWQEYARTVGQYLALPNLSRATTYTFRVYSIALAGLGYTNSAPSAPMSFTTLSAPDSQPPSKPPTPTFSSTTTTVTNIYWAEATDNVQVTGYYLQQVVNGSWTTIRTVGAGERFQTVWGLSPASTYTFGVIAFDARGNQSVRSDAATVTTLATTPYVTCRVQIIAYNPGFTVNVMVINTTTATVSGWSVQFTLPLTTTISSAFNGTVSRNGAAGTFTPAVWYTSIGQGGTAGVGFMGTATPFLLPSGFTVNGAPCTAT